MATTCSVALGGDEAELYRVHHDRLLRSVGRAVNAPEALVEDACQLAWMTLLRRQPDRGPTLFAWLRTVAVHAAYRLSREERRDARLEDLAGEDGWEALFASSRGLDNAIEARRALECLAVLPARQREVLTLRVAGFRYGEIAELGGRPRSMNNVNKHLVKARARIQRMETAAG